jgi:3-dehydroquinate dehydratase-2
MADPTVLLLHGPNLSQLGTRDPAHYGTTTLDEVVALARTAAEGEGARLEHFVSEHEGELVSRLHAARTDGTAAVVINAGALTHYSYALRDALELLSVPKLEVHLSNVHAREPFRRVSVLAEVCDGSVVGLGADGVALAVTAALRLARRAG